MSTPIHLNITCTDCFKGVSFCSGNSDSRRVVYEKGKLREAKKGVLQKLSRKKRDKSQENLLAREQFERLLNETYNIDAQALSLYCGEGNWREKSDHCHPLTRGELSRLIEVAESLSPAEKKVLEVRAPLRPARPQWSTEADFETFEV